MQVGLINYQSMPDCPFKYILDYQDHVMKFCQLRPLTNTTHKAIALEPINIICVFVPPSILQVDNGKKISHATSKSRHVLIDGKV